MTEEQARAVIAQAKTDGTYEGPIPDDAEKALKEAQSLVEMAEVAFKAHVRGPEVTAILNIAGVEYDPDQNPIDEIDENARDEAEQVIERAKERVEMQTKEPFEGYDTLKDLELRNLIAQHVKNAENKTDLLARVWEYESKNKNRKRVLALIEQLGGIEDNSPSEESTEGQGNEEPPQEEFGLGGGFKSPEAEPKPVEFSNGGTSSKGSEGDEGKVDEDYESLLKEVEEELERKRLHKPKEPPKEVPELPYDYSKVTNEELHRLHSVFSSFAYYASYQLQKEERSAVLCGQAADEIARELLVIADHYDDKGKEKRVSLLEAEVESDPNVKKWRKRQKKHQIFATYHRQERDSYLKLVEAMSRLETMRQNEWERSRR